MTAPVLTYKDALIAANTALGDDARRRFVGYGLKKGRALGTLKAVNETQIVETPVAENLMVGLATGLSLRGLLPVVFIERMDFILNALDAIVNHLDKLDAMSGGAFRPAVILRAVVGNRNKPLYTGVTHTQDFTEALRTMVSFPVLRLATAENVAPMYRQADQNQQSGLSTLLIEYKDLV